MFALLSTTAYAFSAAPSVSGDPSPSLSPVRAVIFGVHVIRMPVAVIQFLLLVAVRAAQLSAKAKSASRIFSCYAASGPTAAVIPGKVGTAVLLKGGI